MKAACAGTVLMETIIAIPLFMILLSGIFWIGDLLVTRQKLLIADRYVAWNKGLRYGDSGQTGSDDIHRLFFSDRNGIPSETHKPDDPYAAVTADYDWSHVAQGQVSVKVTMPDWVESMINSQRALYDSAKMENAVDLRGRGQNGLRHVVLMRTRNEWVPSYIRNGYGIGASAKLAKGTWNAYAYPPWINDASQKWPYEK